MFLSGVQPFTLLDYPEHTACIAFTPGCNMRCSFCHNPEFVLPEMIVKIKDTFITEDAFLRFLDSRVGLLDGVVISGGEPTVQGDLLSFLKKIKEKGFLIKLDTNGNRPDIITTALEQSLLDYIAMDVKTSLEQYMTLTGKRTNPENIKKSIEIIKSSTINYEFRTTLIKDIHIESVLKEMSVLVSGAQNYVLQSFRPSHTLDPAFAHCQPFNLQEMKDIARTFFTHHVTHISIR